jgi:hypothetical protein
VRRQVVAGKHQVQVDQQDQPEHGLHRVQHLADVSLVVARRPRPPAGDPARRRDDRGADRGAGERPGGAAEDDQPDDRAADPADRLEREHAGEHREPLGALQHAVGQPDHRDRHQRHRHQQHRPDAVQVQQHHQQRRAGERHGGHGPTGGQPHGVQLPSVACGQ